MSRVKKDSLRAYPAGVVERVLVVQSVLNARKPPELGESRHPMLASFQFWVPAVSVELAAAESTKEPFAPCRTAPKGFRLVLDDIAKLIDSGKEKGYLTYGEVNDLIPRDVHSPESLDDLLTTIGTHGIEVVEGQSKLPTSAFKNKLENEVEASDEVELDLTLTALEKTNDPVRIYLRKMGEVPLLTRQGEVDIAMRIERGQLRVLKALSRSPIVIRQILAIAEDLKHGVRPIKEIIVFDEEEITEEILQNRIKDTTYRIDELQKHYKRASRLAVRLATIPAKKKAREYRRCRCGLGREIVRISLIIRNLGLTNVERERLIDRVNKTVDIMRSLDRQVSNLEKQSESTHSEELCRMSCRCRRKADASNSMRRCSLPCATAGTPSRTSTRWRGQCR